MDKPWHWKTKCLYPGVRNQEKTQSQVSKSTKTPDPGVQTHLLQDLPDFLVEAHRDSVQRSVQTPPAQPLALSGVLGGRDALRNIQRLNGRQPVPLNGQNHRESML